MKNYVSLIGMVGSDPETRTTSSGKQVTNISLCTTEKWKDQQGVKQESVQWHRLVIWGKPAEIAATYVRKGDRLAIDGRIEYRAFTDKENKSVNATDIVVSEFFLIQPAAK